MRILVISDTHGKIDRTIEAYRKLAAEAPVDMSLHYEDSAGGPQSEPDGGSGGSQGDSSRGDSSQGGEGTPASKSMAKPKVKGGHLRDLLNYSDRF